MIVEGGGRLIVEGGPLIRKRRHSYTSKRALHREQNSPAAVTLRGMKSLSDSGDGLLVVVMPVASEYKDKNLVFENAIHQSVLLRDFAAPAVFGLTLQRLGAMKRTALAKAFGSFFSSLASPSRASVVKSISYIRVRSS